MLNTRLITWSSALFTSVSFIFCVVYGLLTPAGVHMHQFLEIVLPAFTWISFGSFVLGLAESFLWGAYFGLIFPPLYNFLYKRLGAPEHS